MKTNLVLTFTSPDRPGIVEDITKVVVHHSGNWEESRLARLCGDFAGLARVTVDESQVQSLVSGLRDLERGGLLIQVKTAEQISTEHSVTKRELVCSGADHEGIVSGLASKLSQHGINVEEMETAVVPAPTTGTPLFRMSCQLSIPESCDLDLLRAELTQLEGELAVEISVGETYKS